MNFKQIFQSFFAEIAAGEIDIYNEFSLQHELGIHLRESLSSISDLKVQFERPVTYFGLDKQLFEKRELDIVIFNDKQTVKHAIELKYPRSGQHPEQMFKACQDICFVEQLTKASFNQSFFIMVTDDPLFYERGRGRTAGIYSYFRDRLPLSGMIEQPTAAGDHKLNIESEYLIEWQHIADERRYAIVSTHCSDD